MKLLTVLTLTLLSLAAAAQDQQATLAFVDTSAPQTIMSFTGSASFTSHTDSSGTTINVTGSLSMTNVSGRNILMYSGKGYCGTFGDGFNTVWEHDYYFKSPMVMAPGESQSLWENAPYSRNFVPPNAPQSPSSCTVTLLAVQFDDGSSWGDAGELARIQSARKDYLAELKAIAGLYSSGGEAAVKAEIAYAHTNSSMETRVMLHKLQTLYRSPAGIQAVMTEVGLRTASASAKTF